MTISGSTLLHPVVIAPFTVGLLFIYYLFIDPRPYFIAAIDTDHDYYFNAQLILDTGFPGRANHPGMPVYYAVALIAGIGRLFSASPQFVMNIGYLMVAGVTAAAFSYFFHVLRHVIPRTILWLSLAVFLSWPTVIFYLNMLASDVMSIAVTVAAVGYFWRHWIIEGHPTRRQTVVLAVALALAASLKLTVVPVIAVTWFIVAVGVFYGSRSGVSAGFDYMDPASFYPRWRRLSAALAGPVITAGAFAVLLLPAWGVFPIMLKSFMSRFGSTTRFGPTADSSVSALSWYADNTPVVALIFLLSLTVLVVSALLFWKRRRDGITIRLQPRMVLGGIYAAVLFLALLSGLNSLVDQARLNPGDQALISIGPTWNLGLSLRQLGPTFVALPVMMLFGALLAKEAGFTGISRRSVQRVILVAAPVLSLGLVLWSVTDLVADRTEHMDGWKNELIPAMQAFESDPSIEGRVAFGVTYNGIPGLFDLWGDYTYNEHRFQDEITARVNHVALFVIKQAGVWVDDPARNEPPVRSGFLLVAQNIYWDLPKYLPSFRDVIDSERTIASDDLIRGSIQNDEVDRIVFLTQSREVVGASREGMESLLITEFGPGDYYDVEMFGHRWEVFDIDR